MQFIYDFIDFISDTFDQVFVFVGNLIFQLTEIKIFINNVIDTVYELIFTLPLPLQAFAIGTISVCVFYQLFHIPQGGSKSDG